MVSKKRYSNYFRWEGENAYANALAAASDLLNAGVPEDMIGDIARDSTNATEFAYSITLPEAKRYGYTADDFASMLGIEDDLSAAEIEDALSALASLGDIDVAKVRAGIARTHPAHGEKA